MDLDRHCKRANCMCTHDEPCYAGWVIYDYVEEVKSHVKGITSIKLIDRESARPCMVCDIDRYNIWYSSKTTHEYHERLRSLSNSNRSKAYEKDEREKTRTL